MNIGYFIFSISKSLMELGNKLYQLFTYEIDISFVSKIMSFFGSNIDIPDTLSLSYLLGGASVVLLITLIAYNVFKL